jgi:phosphoglycolate phosphatase
MINRIRGVIFDLDGTLLYTLEDIRNSLNHALQVHGFPPLDLERVARPGRPRFEAARH